MPQSPDRFSVCLAFVLKAEGGFSNDPRDPGGATNFGITARTLADFTGHPVDIEEVRNLTPTVAGDVYSKLYWAPTKCDKLPAGVDIFTFDTAVNMGVGRAAKMLQTALGVTADGDIGPLTLKAQALTYPRAVIQKMSKLREGRYRSLDDFDHFGKGWLNRLASVTDQALKDAA